MNFLLQNTSCCKCGSRGPDSITLHHSWIWQCCPCSSGLRVRKNTWIKKLWNFSLWLRRALEARHLAGVRPLPGAVKVKPGLSWRPHNVSGARDGGCLPRKPAHSGRNQPKREQWAAGSKARRVKSFEPFGIGHETVGFRVCPAGFESCFGSFPHYVPITPLGISMHILCHCMLEIYKFPLSLTSSYN